MKRGIAAIVAIGTVCITLYSIFNFIIYDKETLSITNGELHLQSSDLGEKETLTLDGEWEFYPGEMIRPDEGKTNF